MGIFGGSTNAFDGMIEKVTDEKNTAEDWGEIMSICDRVGSTSNGPKECLRALVKRLNNQDPHVVLQAITVLDACVNNCGRNFLLEVASREFETEFKKLLTKSHPKVVEKLKLMLKKWSDGEFSKDPAYSLIPALFASLRREGMDFSSEEERVKKRKVPSDPMAVSSQQEEEDIAKAIQLSLQETKGGSSGNNSSAKTNSNNVLYPSDSLYSGGAAASSSTPISSSSSSGPSVRKEEEKKARALYDFEAAEDNEMTFKAGEIVIILDDADPNWWKGSNHRGEGLFPSNFVSMDLNPVSEKKRSVVFNEEVEVKEVEQVTWPQQSSIDEGKIDSLLGMLHDADPTTGEHDPPDLARLEEQVNCMGPMIDNELERVDRRHAQLTRLSHQLVDALTLYHTLMRDMPPAPSYGGFPQQPGMYGMGPMGPGQPMPGMMPPGGMPMPGPPMSMPGGPPMSMGPPAGPQMSMAQPHMSQPNNMAPNASNGQPNNMIMTATSGAGGSMPSNNMPPQTMSMNTMQHNSMQVGPMPSMPPTNMAGGPMPPNSMQGGHLPPPGQGQMYMDPYMFQSQGGYNMMPGSAPPPTPPLQDQQLSVHQATTAGQQQQI